MDKLTGHGRPHAHFAGEVGQHYEDLDTGDIYECRIAQQYSPTHGWPVGGYVWERRINGEKVRDGLIGGKGGFGYTERKVILKQTVITSSNTTLPIELEGGATYEVCWDGEVFLCGCNGEYLGNLGILDLGGNSDEPFLITDNGGMRLYYFDSGEHTISITKVVYHTLDREYLPYDMRIELDGFLWDKVTYNGVRIASGSIQEVVDKIWRGEPVIVKVRSVSRDGSLLAQAQEVEANVSYYGGHLVVNWSCATYSGDLRSRTINFNPNGTIGSIYNKTASMTAQ